MKSSTVPVGLVLVAALAALAKADMKDKIMPRYIKHTLECLKEDTFDTSVCKDMFKDGNDNSHEKYNKCKCIIACVSKKAKVMTEAGDSDIEAFTKAVDEFQISEWTEEWKRVKPLCDSAINSGKKNCDLAYDFFVCGHDKSEIFRGVIHKFAEALDKN